MIVFWLLVVLMVVVALVFLLRPLRLDSSQTDADRAAQNVAITKERIVDVKQDLEQGVISQSEYEQSRQELELSLLNDVEQSGSEKTKSINYLSYNRFTRLALTFIIPITALSFYTFLGAPNLVEGGKKQAGIAAEQGSVKEMEKLQQFEGVVAKLAERMKKKPDNAEGWFMLGRSYLSLRHYEKSVDALEKAYQLAPKNPAVLLMYADALTMLRNGQISGKPFELIKRAVEIKPDDVTGLWLLGMGYDELGEYKKAILYWNKLLPLLKNEEPIKQVNKLIRLAKNKAGITTTEEPTVTQIKKAITSLKVNVSIAKAQLKHVSMDDTVFIFAKAVNGPPMPLAVVRKQVKDLPIEVTLDDSMAMIPNMKLSAFDEVNITARVSKTGQPLLQKGDVFSKKKLIQLPFSDLINIEIDSVAN